MDKKVKVGLAAASMIATISIIAMIVKAYRKRKADKQNEAHSSFREQLENTAEPEKIERAALQQAFDPDFWRTVQHGVISKSKANTLAKKIEAAWNGGTFWDDLEEQVYEAFNDALIKTFADVSRVAEEYKQKEVAGKDLWNHLEYKLSDSEFAKVKAIVIKKIAK